MRCVNSLPAQSIPIGRLDVAGQRVQVIRRAKGKGGVLEFGTTVLCAADGTIGGLLGASPGCLHRGACDARSDGSLLF